jgi:hypothetical protein
MSNLIINLLPITLTVPGKTNQILKVLWTNMLALKTKIYSQTHMKVTSNLFRLNIIFEQWLQQIGKKEIVKG